MSQNNNVIRGAREGNINALLQQAGMIFTSVTADPAIPTGTVAMWYRSDLDRWRVQDAAGVIHNVVVSPLAEGDIGAGAVGSTELAANAVGGAALSSSAMRLLAFAGHNGAGACTLTGAKVGDKVIGIIDLAAGSVSAAASFESTISVADQIQQTSVSNLSAVKYAALVVAKS